jgi:hypothetical protein
MGQSASMDENAITDLVADIHPRAAAKVRAFAEVLFIIMLFSLQNLRGGKFA